VHCLAMQFAEANLHARTGHNSCRPRTERDCRLALIEVEHRVRFAASRLAHHHSGFCLDAEDVTRTDGWGPSVVPKGRLGEKSGLKDSGIRCVDL